MAFVAYTITFNKINLTGLLYYLVTITILGGTQHDNTYVGIYSGEGSSRATPECENGCPVS